MFIGLLTSIFNASNDTNFVSLNNQLCITQTTPIKLHPNEQLAKKLLVQKRMSEVVMFFMIYLVEHMFLTFTWF